MSRVHAIPNCYYGIRRNDKCNEFVVWRCVCVSERVCSSMDARVYAAIRSCIRGCTRARVLSCMCVCWCALLCMSACARVCGRTPYARVSVLTYARVSVLAYALAFVDVHLCTLVCERMRVVLRRTIVY